MTLVHLCPDKTCKLKFGTKNKAMICSCIHCTIILEKVLCRMNFRQTSYASIRIVLDKHNEKKPIKIDKYILPLSTSGNGVICKKCKDDLNLSDVIHDEIGLNLYRGSVLQ